MNVEFFIEKISNNCPSMKEISSSFKEENIERTNFLYEFHKPNYFKKKEVNDCLSDLIYNSDLSDKGFGNLQFVGKKYNFEDFDILANFADDWIIIDKKSRQVKFLDKGLDEVTFICAKNCSCFFDIILKYINCFFEVNYRKEKLDRKKLIEECVKLSGLNNSESFFRMLFKTI